MTQTNCARSACQVPLEPGQTFYNRSTQQLYCRTCAVKLNRANEADALRLYGGPLCVPAEQAKAVSLEPDDLLGLPKTGG